MKTRLRRNVGNCVLFAAFTVPLLICTASWAVPAFVQRPHYIAFYIAPFALNFLLWVRCRLLTCWASVDTQLALDGLAVGISALRLAGPIVPTSGHMLFFVFTLLTTSVAWYRLLTFALIAATTYIKLVVWQDHASWALGVLAGLAPGIVYRAPTLVRRFRKDGSRTAESPTT